MDSFQSASNSISKRGPYSCKDSLPSAPCPGQEIKKDMPGGEPPGHLSPHSPAGTRTISFILHDCKNVASRGGYCILPLGAVRNSTNCSDRCITQLSQLLICNQPLLCNARTNLLGWELNAQAACSFLQLVSADWQRHNCCARPLSRTTTRRQYKWQVKQCKRWQVPMRLQPGLKGAHRAHLKTREQPWRSISLYLQYLQAVATAGMCVGVL